MLYVGVDVTLAEREQKEKFSDRKIDKRSTDENNSSGCRQCNQTLKSLFGLSEYTESSAALSRWSL